LQGLTVIVGEFAATSPDGCNWVNIDVVNILTECKTKNIGYLGKIHYTTFNSSIVYNNVFSSFSGWSWHGKKKNIL
jgi:hypothetical protein